MLLEETHAPKGLDWRMLESNLIPSKCLLLFETYRFTLLVYIVHVGVTILVFTITTEIHVRSLANFYCQYVDRHKFKIHATRQRARGGNSTVCYRKKQIDVSF